MKNVSKNVIRLLGKVFFFLFALFFGKCDNKIKWRVAGKSCSSKGLNEIYWFCNWFLIEF